MTLYKAPKKLKICFVSATKGFCHLYRMKFPGDVLKEKGLAEVRYVDPNLLDELIDGQMWADIIVFQYTAPHQYFVKLAELIRDKKLNKLLVAEFDDDVFNVDPHNDAYRSLGTKEYSLLGKKLWEDGEDDFSIKNNKKTAEDIAKAIVVADIVTVTTPELQKRYKIFNENIVMLPNYIQPNKMPIYEKEKSNRVTIGWMGSDSHAKDLFDIMPALERIKKEYGARVHFKFMGSFMARKLYKRVRGEFVPWIRPNLFYERFATMPFDIGIIACSDTPFNRAKSVIKWLEYSHYKIPTIAPDLIPYKDHIKHDRTGMLYGNNNNLYVFIKSLIEDPIQRMILAGSAKAQVEEHYDINKFAKDWVDAYSYALERKVNSY